VATAAAVTVTVAVTVTPTRAGGGACSRSVVPLAVPLPGPVPVSVLTPSAQVAAWKLRGALPLALEATANLVDARLVDHAGAYASAFARSALSPSPPPRLRR
jgi:hypothetical protein